MNEWKVGQRVRVTVEGEVDYVGSHSIDIHYTGPDGRWRANAFDVELCTVEAIEDLRPGDMVCDADGIWFFRTLDNWLLIPQSIARSDECVRRPFAYHFRGSERIGGTS